MDAKERVELLGNSPLAIRFAQEHDAEIRQQREAAALRIRRAVADAEATLPSLEAELVVAEAELVAYDSGREAPVKKLRLVKLALAQARVRIDQEKANAESVLLTTADRRIEEAIAWFRQRHQNAYQKPILIKELVGGTVNPFTLDRQAITQTNFAAATEAVGYCMNAIRELEGMKFSVVANLERIAALKEGVPDATRPAHVEVSRPVPRPVVPTLKEILSDRMMQVAAGLEVVTERLGEQLEVIEERKDKVVETIKKVLHNRGVGQEGDD